MRASWRTKSLPLVLRTSHFHTAMLPPQPVPRSSHGPQHRARLGGNFPERGPYANDPRVLACDLHYAAVHHDYPPPGQALALTCTAGPGTH